MIAACASQALVTLGPGWKNGRKLTHTYTLDGNGPQ
jgi:hypothetical protein